MHIYFEVVVRWKIGELRQRSLEGAVVRFPSLTCPTSSEQDKTIEFPCHIPGQRTVRMYELILAGVISYVFTRCNFQRQREIIMASIHIRGWSDFFRLSSGPFRFNNSGGLETKVNKIDHNYLRESQKLRLFRFGVCSFSENRMNFRVWKAWCNKIAFPLI